MAQSVRTNTMGLTIKICGLSTADTLDATLGLGVDMVGFVFFPKSPRHISFESAKALGAQAHGRAQKVALCVDADDALLEAICQTMQPDLLQLHGHETPERVAQIRARYGRPVIKALGISNRADLAQVAGYRDCVDWLLFDAKPPRDAQHPGGNGLAFDWVILQGQQFGRPAMVSGGLEPDNVAKAIEISMLDGVDVSSGVESAPGIKSIDKIANFIGQARAGFASRSGSVSLRAGV